MATRYSWRILASLLAAVWSAVGAVDHPTSVRVMKRLGVIPELIRRVHGVEWFVGHAQPSQTAARHQVLRATVRPDIRVAPLWAG